MLMVVQECVFYFVASLFSQERMVMLVAMHFIGAVEIWFLGVSTRVLLPKPLSVIFVKF